MLGRTVPSEEIGENLEYIIGSSPSTDPDRQTPPRVLVEHGQELQRSAVMGPRAHEVVGPHVILMQWPEPDARAIVEPTTDPVSVAVWALSAPPASRSAPHACGSPPSPRCVAGS